MMVGSYITRGNTHAFWHAELTCSYMPVKTRRAAAKKEREKSAKDGTQVPQPERNVKKVDSGYLAEPKKQAQEDEASAGDKRRKSVTPETSHKAPKVATLNANHSKKSELKATPVQCLKFLLSDDVLDICRPDEEVEATASKEGKDLVSYSQLLSPFEELLCAVILSRPISHRLGLRTIRTILNPPYQFSNPVAIKTAGAVKVRQALDDAHTQHKGKTTEEIDLLAEAVTNNDWHNDLERIRKQSKGSVEAERELLRRSVKGLGKTGLDIFYRRIQWLWDEAFPFVDARTLSSLEKLGLPKRPESIMKMIEVRWGEIAFKDDDSKYSEAEQQRRAFVLLLERAVGADLEKRIDEVLEQASKL